MGTIPRGIEVLVKKATVDPAFRKLLLDTRADAAHEIGLELEPSEVAMLNATPRDQLDAIIAQTTVSPRQRAAFMGKVAAVMLLAVGVAAINIGGCTMGCRIDDVDEEEEQSEVESGDDESSERNT